MTYDIAAHREGVRAWCLRLAAAGRGWHDYAKDKAQRLVKEDPELHQDLEQAVAREINPTAPQRAPTRRP